MITARPMAMPGETPMPLYVRTSLRFGGVSLVARSASMSGSFYFVEFGLDELLDGLDRFFLVFTVGGHADDGAFSGGQEQDAEDALAVDFLVAFADFDVGFESRRAMDQLCGGARVQTELVLDLDVARDQCPLTLPFGPPSPRSCGARVLARSIILRVSPPITDPTQHEWPSIPSR